MGWRIWEFEGRVVRWPWARRHGSLVAGDDPARDTRACVFPVDIVMGVREMKRLAVLLMGAACWWGGDQSVQAQVPYVTFYQPVTVYQPVLPPPPVVYYAPPAPVAYQPVARVRTRYRPFLGRTVTRVRYGYAPVYAPAPLVFAY